jgi:DNA polymerase-3 subunit beta
MRLIVERGALAKALNHVASVVERRNTIPILSNVRIEGRSGELVLTATDLDVEIVESLPAEVSSEGGTTVPAHVLHDIVRKLPDGAQVSLELKPEDGRMILTCGQARFQLQVLPPADFPALDAADLGHAFDIDAKELKRLIEKTSFAISTEETRYYLNGIYLHRSGQGGEARLRAVATDGHRLAQAETALPDGAAEMPGVIVPRKTVEQLHRLVEASDDPVRIELSDAKLRLSAGRVVLTSKLIDGTFPDYERVIPQGNDKMLTVDNSEFAHAVDRVSTLSSDKGRAVKLTLSGGKLLLSVNNPDSGSATEELAVDYDSEPLEIGFNARYLLDISKQLDGSAAHFRLADAGSPTMVVDGENSSASALYVLMPMRV